MKVGKKQFTNGIVSKRKQRRKLIKCKLTGIEGKGVDSHIIPRSFYRWKGFRARIRKHELIALQGDISHRPQRTTAKGIYDNTILVEEGEKLFSDWDDYACELLVKLKANGQRIFVDGRETGVEIAEYNYTKLKLFFVSLLWRAHTTRHRFFGNVELEDFHEQKIRQMILNGSPGEVDDYPVTIGYCENNKAGWLPIVSPWQGMRRNKKTTHSFSQAGSCRSGLMVKDVILTNTSMLYRRTHPLDSQT